MSDQRNSSGGITSENETEAFTHLGSMIQNPLEHLGQRNNVRHAIKDQVCSIRVTYFNAKEDTKKD